MPPRRRIDPESRYGLEEVFDDEPIYDEIEAPAAPYTDMDRARDLDAACHIFELQKLTLEP